MKSINVNRDINYVLNHIKKSYYDLILNNLQKGWIDYIEERTMNEWLQECDANTKYNYNSDNDYEYEWYNKCWKDWIRLNYNINREHLMSRIEHEIWSNLLNEDKIKLKIIIYIILISFGFYITY
jgi:hypothetical protein